MENITDEISKLNENTSTLQQAINIRNYYSQVINQFISIEYLEPSVIDYVNLVEGDTIIYDMRNWCYINVNLINYVYKNLGLITNKKNNFIDDIDKINIGIIENIFDIISDIKLETISQYYDGSYLKDYIDTVKELTTDEKEELKKLV